MLWNSRGVAGEVRTWEGGERSAEPERFEVVVAETHPFCGGKESRPKYLRISSGPTEVLKVRVRRGAESRVLLVSAQSLLIRQEFASVYQATGRQFKFFRLLHDPQQRVALVGFVLGVFGLVVKLAGDIKVNGKAWLPDQWVIASDIVAVSLQSIGLLLVLVDKLKD